RPGAAWRGQPPRGRGAALRRARPLWGRGVCSDSSGNQLPGCTQRGREALSGGGGEGELSGRAQRPGASHGEYWAGVLSLGRRRRGGPPVAGRLSTLPSQESGEESSLSVGSGFGS